MPDTGAPWAITYVSASDLVSDWPTDNQTMAESVADALDIVKAFGSVQRVVKTNQFSMTGSTPTLVTDLSLNITPSTNTSLIYIAAGINLGNDNGSGQYAWRIDRSSTQICQQFMTDTGDEDFFRTIVMIDNPATTSSTNYNVKIWSPNAVGTVYVNQTGTVQRSSLLVAEILP